MAINRKDVNAAIDAHKAGVSLLPLGPKGDFEFDMEKSVEVQTDKEQVKIVPCRECHGPIVVTTFFAPAKAICSTCTGVTANDPGSKKGTVGQPIPGQTDPAKAVDLEKTLVNHAFAKALCPVHPENPDHEMQLVSVVHSDNYGPSKLMGYNGGKPVYRQEAVGETVMHQCQNCKAMTTYTTTRQNFIKPINEPRSLPDTGHRPGFILETLQGIKLDEQAA